MKIKDLEQCQRMAIFKGVIANEGNNYSLTAKIMKKTLTELRNSAYDTSNVSNLVEYYFSELNPKFSTSFEAEAKKDDLIYYLTRFAQWKQENPTQLIATNVRETVTVYGVEFDVFLDAIETNGNGDFYYIKTQLSSPKLSMNGRSPKTKVSENPDLALMQLCGDAFMKKFGYPLNGFATSIHLKAKNESYGDRGNLFIPNDRGNVISYKYTSADYDRIFLNKVKRPSLENVAEDRSTCSTCPYSGICWDTFEASEKESKEKADSVKKTAPSLTEAQENIINHQSGVLRCNSVPGSGKTETVSTAAVQKALNGDSVICITFTDKAEKELAERIDSKLEEPLDNMVITNYNKFGQEIIDNNYGILGFSAPPKLIDDVEKSDIIIELLANYSDILPLNFRNPFEASFQQKGAIHVIKQIIDTLKANNVTSAIEVSEQIQTMPEYSLELFDIYNQYNAYLLEHDLLDFEDQLRLIKNLKNTGVLSNLGYQHIIVDEFQDSNKNQIEIISLLYYECKSKSLTVVGDEMQAIYGFRNATPENLITLERYFPNIQDVHLADNFRSATPIISLANRMCKNINPTKAPIIPRSTSLGEAPKLQQVNPKSDDEDLFIVQEIEAALVRNNGDLSKIAILAKTKAELLHIQEVLSTKCIPSVLKTPKLVMESSYVKAIISLARYLDNPKNMIDFAYYTKSLGLNSLNIADVKLTEGILANTLNSLTSESEKIVSFFSLVDHCRADYVGAHFIEILHEKCFNTLEELTSFCIKYQDYSPRDTVSAAQEKANAITLITIHSSKGLEWDTVVLSAKKFFNSDEEKRLLYVGVTRAKSQLAVTFEQKQKYMFDSLLA